MCCLLFTHAMQLGKCTLWDVSMPCDCHAAAAPMRLGLKLGPSPRPSKNLGSRKTRRRIHLCLHSPPYDIRKHQSPAQEHAPFPSCSTAANPHRTLAPYNSQSRQKTPAQQYCPSHLSCIRAYPMPPAGHIFHFFLNFPNLRHAAFRRTPLPPSRRSSFPFCPADSDCCCCV